MAMNKPTKNDPEPDPSAARMYFDHPPMQDRPDESRRQRNRRWRQEMARYRASRHSLWTPTELIWAKRLETLLNEKRG